MKIVRALSLVVFVVSVIALTIANPFSNHHDLSLNPFPFTLSEQIADAATPSGMGIFIVNSCSSITNPVANGTWCFTPGPPPLISLWNGGGYVQVVGSGGSATVVFAGVSSNVTETATTLANQSHVTIGAAGDISTGNQIGIPNAGPSPTVSAPSLTVTPYANGGGGWVKNANVVRSYQLIAVDTLANGYATSGGGSVITDTDGPVYMQGFGSAEGLSWTCNYNSYGTIVLECQGTGPYGGSGACVPNFLTFIKTPSNIAGQVCGFDDYGLNQKQVMITRGPYPASTGPFQSQPIGAPYYQGASYPILPGSVVLYKYEAGTANAIPLCVDTPNSNGTTGNFTTNLSGNSGQGCTSGTITYATGLVTSLVLQTALINQDTLWMSVEPNSNQLQASAIGPKNGMYLGTVTAGAGTTSLTVTPPVNQTATSRIEHCNDAAYAAALAALPNGGGTVSIPAGVFNFCGPQSIPDQVHVVGTGGGGEAPPVVDTSQLDVATYLTVGFPDDFNFFDIRDGSRQWLENLVLDLRYVNGVSSGNANATGLTGVKVDVDVSLNDSGGTDKTIIDGVETIDGHRGIDVGGQVFNIGGSIYLPNSDISEFEINRFEDLQDVSAYTDQMSTGIIFQNSQIYTVKMTHDTCELTDSCLDIRNAGGNILVDTLSSGAWGGAGLSQAVIHNGADASITVQNQEDEPGPRGMLYYSYLGSRGGNISIPIINLIGNTFGGNIELMGMEALSSKGNTTAKYSIEQQWLLDGGTFGTNGIFAPIVEGGPDNGPNQLPDWVLSTTYPVGYLIQPLVGNAGNFIYYNTNGGGSCGTEPATFNQTAGTITTESTGTCPSTPAKWSNTGRTFNSWFARQDIASSRIIDFGVWYAGVIQNYNTSGALYQNIGGTVQAANNIFSRVTAMPVYAGLAPAFTLCPGSTNAYNGSTGASCWATALSLNLGNDYVEISEQLNQGSNANALVNTVNYPEVNDVWAYGHHDFYLFQNAPVKIISNAVGGSGGPIVIQAVTTGNEGGLTWTWPVTSGNAGQVLQSDGGAGTGYTWGNPQFNLSGGTGLFGSSAIYATGDQLVASKATTACHFTILSCVNLTGGTCSGAAPTFNVFDTSSSNEGTPLTCSTSQQSTLGTVSSQAETLSIASGSVFGIYVSTQGSTCTVPTFSVTADIVCP